MTSRQNFEDRKVDTTNNTDGKKKNIEDKMSEQKNTTIEHPHEMENAAEDRATQSTSRTSSRKKVAPSPTLSEISDLANMLVSDTMEQVADNVSELLDSIKRWVAEEEHAKSEGESSAACCTQQKVERNLKRFFDIRRVFAEHRGEAPEVTEEREVELHATDSTEKSCDSDMTKKRPVFRHGSKMFKRMKSTWKACFRWTSRKKNRSPEKEDLDETAESDDSDSKSVSPCPEDTAPTASTCSSVDTTFPQKGDLRSVPLELVDKVEYEAERLWIMDDNDAETADLRFAPTELVKAADKDVTPEKFIVETSLAVTQKTSPTVSTCSYDMSADPLLPTISSLSSSTKLAERREPSLVHRVAEKNVDETHSSDVRPICSSRKQMSPITWAGSSENIGAAEPGDRSSVLSEKLAMDFSLGEQCREETGRHKVRSVVTEGDFATKMDSTLVLSGQDGPASSNLKGIATCPEKMSLIVSVGSSELSGLQNTFYIIVKEFFDGLTERQRTEISRGIYYMDVKDKLLDICVDVLTVILQAITDMLTDAIRQNPDILWHCRLETFKQKLLSQLLGMKFDITDDSIQQTLGSVLGTTFCDVVSAETSIKIPHKFKESIVKKITDEFRFAMPVAIPASEDGESIVNENTWCGFSTSGACKILLSNVKTILCGLKCSKQTSQTVSNDSDAPTIKVHKKKKSRWWRCFRKPWNKIQPVSDKQMDTEDSGHTPPYLQDDKDKRTNEIKAPAQDPAVETKRPSLLKRIRRFCCRLCCCSPGDIEQ